MSSNYSTLADGRLLHYREAGHGLPLVLLHGWSMSSAVFQEVMAGLSADFRVLAPDLSGHGSSAAPQGEFTLAALTADLEDWLAGLGVDSVSLVGWSLGGQVALQMAQRRQLVVERMILVATTPLFVARDDWSHGLPATQVRAMDRQLQRDYRGGMSAFFRLMFAGEEIAPERYREIVRFAVRDGALPDPEIARQGLHLLGNVDLRPYLSAIDLPVLIHEGALDQITVPAAGRFLAETIPAAEFVSWPEVGHAPFLSRPDASVELWREFLR